MKLKALVLGSVAAGMLAAAGYGAYAIGMQRGMAMLGAGAPAAPAGSASGADPSSWTLAQGEEATRRHIKDGIKAGDVDPATGRKVLHYQDPMVPGKRFEAPGKSPFMEMMLVPVYAGAEGGDTGRVTVSPRIRQNIGLRTAPVVEGRLAPQLSAVGSIAYNERDLVIVQARAMGYLERLHVRATLDRVEAGQALAELYVPDWVAAQEEFLSVRRMQGSGLEALVEGARQRMRQAGMSEEQIALVESTGAVHPRFTIRAPRAGVVSELAAREGMTVMPGMTLFRINGLASVWANAEVPETQAALLAPGTKVQASSPAVPGVTFQGRVQAILPEVDVQTRTLKVRMELATPKARLVPGMFVQMTFLELANGRSLLVPSEAVIQTGRRTVVMLAEEDGTFRPVEIEIGIESGDRTEVKRGLRLGQRVVLSGQFLIDSEASLKGLEARLASDAPAAAGAVHRTEARVEAVKDGLATLSHPPVPSLNWPAMTMDFRLPDGGAERGALAPGATVSVEFRMEEGELPQLTSVRRLAPAAGARK